MAHGGVAFDQYRAYMVRRGYCRGTVRTRLSVARDFTARFDIAAATWRDIEEWAADKHLAAGSMRNLLVNLRAFYHWGRRVELVDHDPTELVDRPPVPVRLPRPATEQAIAGLIRDADPQLKALVARLPAA